MVEKKNCSLFQKYFSFENSQFTQFGNAQVNGCIFVSLSLLLFPGIY